MKRRAFLRLSAAAGAGLMLPSLRATAASNQKLYFPQQYKQVLPELFAAMPKPPSYTPALVIGSGFGGAISAWRLAQRGIQTTVLERGQRWPRDPQRQIFTTDTSPDGRGYWHRTSIVLFDYKPCFFDYFGGIFDATDYANIQVWRGACVGGGSMVYTGVMIEPQKKYFEAIFGNTVGYDEMHQTYYPRVRQMLRLSTMPDDIYNTAPFSHSRIWDQQVRAAGYSPYLTDSVFNWDVVRAELNGSSRPSATVGESNLGNANGAKFDLNQNYLKYAEESGFANIYSGMQVLGIARDSDKRYLVEIQQLDPFGKELDRFTVATDYLFLGAGSIGTSELLVRARARGDIANLNEHIGEGWGTNGDSAVIRSGTPDAGAGNKQGTPCRSGITDEINGLPTTMENWYQLQVGPNLGVCGSLGMVFDQSNRGNFTYDAKSDKVTLNWAKTGNDDANAVTKALNRKICDASGATPGFPFAKEVNTGFTAHPLGGAVIGKATDAYGRVLGQDRLYVMDGAAIPGSTGAVNPSLTISALAERNIEKILQTDF